MLSEQNVKHNRKKLKDTVEHVQHAKHRDFSRVEYICQMQRFKNDKSDDICT